MLEGGGKWKEGDGTGGCNKKTKRNEEKRGQARKKKDLVDGRE